METLSDDELAKCLGERQVKQNRMNSWLLNRMKNKFRRIYGPFRFIADCLGDSRVVGEGNGGFGGGNARSPFVIAIARI